MIRQVKIDCDRQVVLENRGYRSATCRTLRSLQKVQGAKEIWGCTCVTAPPFFSKTDPIAVRNSDMTATGKCGNTDEPVVIVWDGLNEKERECNTLDVNGKTLGTVETTRLLVDNKEE